MDDIKISLVVKVSEAAGYLTAVEVVEAMRKLKSIMRMMETSESYNEKLKI